MEEEIETTLSPLRQIITCTRVTVCLWQAMWGALYVHVHVCVCVCVCLEVRLSVQMDHFIHV